MIDLSILDGDYSPVGYDSVVPRKKQKVLRPPFMRVPRQVCIRLLGPAILFAPLLASACERIPAGETIWIRLTAPVSTYDAKAGDPVHGVVTQDITCGNETVAPLGSHVAGHVESSRRVGLGFRHETAALKISFDEIQISGAQPMPITASLVTIDNAREPVSNGVVHGIRSTNTLQGTITSRLKYLPALNPYPDMGLIVFKAAFPIFPEPEIYLPQGTEIQLKLEAAVSNPPSSARVEDSARLDAMNPAELRALVSPLPEHSTTQNKIMADVVNLAFLGSQAQFEAALSHAGWKTADPVNRHSIVRNMYAFLQDSSYYQAPMRPFLLEGRAEDMNWEKSLNTYAQRDHMRVWAWQATGSTDTVFVATATHDRSGGISLKHHEFVHHIDADIDDERSKVIRDLRAAGCVQAVYLVPRRDIAPAGFNAVGDPVRTDGSMAVVQLQDCHAVVPELESDATPAPYRPGSRMFRYFRREVLTVRSDMLRANIIYGTYDVLRMGFHAWKRHVAVAAANAASTPATHAMAERSEPQNPNTP